VQRSVKALVGDRRWDYDFGRRDAQGRRVYDLCWDQGLTGEPVDHGVGYTGPPPFGLLMSGLGARTAITFRMYAERKNLALEGSTSSGVT
jgi:hypothetical protein